MTRRLWTYLPRLAAAILIIAAAPLQAATDRVALVIGNSDYAFASKLANPRNDAEALAAKLRALGFQTIEGYDLGIAGMREKTQDFARASRSAEISLFFYAGHGIQVDGTNYLVPVDARMEDALAIDFEAFSIDLVTRQMSFSKGANLIILDACRDNPFEDLSRSLGGASRSIATRGLGEMDVTDTGIGTGIVFATAPGDVAEDGNGRNSPFTSALLNNIGTPNTPFTSIMTRVTGEVFAATDGRQRPWFNQSFTGEVVLHDVPVEAAPAPVAAAPAPNVAAPSASAEDERFMFDIARDSGYVEDYETYLDFYPNGRFARFARLAIERLTPTDASPAEPEQIVAQADIAETPSSPVEVAPTAIASRAYDPTAPLVLAPTQTALLAPATQQSETALAMDREKRREVQARLNASGHKVGRPDGMFGPRTRGGIAAWQTANGLPATQHLNALQLAMLTSQTEATYQAFLTAPASPARTKPTNSTPRKAQQAAPKQQTNVISGGIETVGKTIDGVILGIGRLVTGQ
ncbi:caspase family protein [Meridianimarinicoccus aquatilis]|uniref:Caspase n=1 Tax=Meridianimarinicoccus aquatilis TaxID=2552766 RepID=A0A4R6AWL5_9RHOB|nr:caspase family protein [Fluviibacterium aquatile]TDL88034.1 caspase [Fluviibacterium aquatile]